MTVAQFAVDDDTELDVSAFGVRINKELDGQDVTAPGLGDAFDLQDFAGCGAVFLKEGGDLLGGHLAVLDGTGLCGGQRDHSGFGGHVPGDGAAAAVGGGSPQHLVENEGLADPDRDDGSRLRRGDAALLGQAQPRNGRCAGHGSGPAQVVGAEEDRHGLVNHGDVKAEEPGDGFRRPLPLVDEPQDVLLQQGDVLAVLREGLDGDAGHGQGSVDDVDEVEAGAGIPESDGQQAVLTER
ncbi:hypothetical protein [Streptomyces zhihengii]